MKTHLKTLISGIFIFLFWTSVGAQINHNSAAIQTTDNLNSSAPLKEISDDLAKISKSVDTLNARMKKFTETFSTNQGLIIDEKQQKILFAFEILNRAEQRLLTLQNLKLILTDKQIALKLQLARNTDNLLPESVDKYVATRGTLNAEQLRDIRRQALSREKNETTTLYNDNENTLRQTVEELRQTEQFLTSIRQRIFPEALRQLSGL